MSITSNKATNNFIHSTDIIKNKSPPTPSSSSSNKPVTLQLLWYTEAIAGGIAGISTDAIFYPLDTYKVMKQTDQRIKIKRLLRGVLPIAISGSGPSFAIFFGTYAPLKRTIQDKVFGGEGKGEGLSVLLASVLAGIPSRYIYIYIYIMIIVTNNINNFNSYKLYYQT
jgi:hypothetical protein